MKKQFDCRLYLVTDRELVGGKDFYHSIEEGLRGGVTLLQLREKDISTREFYDVAVKVKDIAVRFGIPLIINDRLDIALAIDADGLHIGQDDMPLVTARRLMGTEKIIGVSTFTVAESLLAEQEGADYLGVGAVFPTGSKRDARHVTLPELAAIKQSVSVPVVAIGGIQAANARQVMAAGIDGISVISAILAQADVRRAAQTLRNEISQSS